MKNFLSLYNLNEEAQQAVTFAEKLAIAQGRDHIRCSHLLFAIAHLNPHVLELLLGVKITRLPQQYMEAIEKAAQENAVTDELELAPELEAFFAIPNGADPVDFLINHLRRKEFGPGDLAFTVLSDPTPEIAEFLLQNNVPNDAARYQKKLQTNFVSHLTEMSAENARKRLKTARKNSSLLAAELEKQVIGQERAIAEVSSGLCQFWSCGNDGRPYRILFVCREGGGSSYIINRMQAVFQHQLQLQSAPAVPVEMNGLVSDSSAEVELLGTGPSYKNAGPGLLYRTVEAAPRGIIVFENIQECRRDARQILRSFLQGTAVDKFYNCQLNTPLNVVCLTLKLEETPFKTLLESRSGAIDPDWLSKNLKDPQSGEETVPGLESLLKSIDKIVLLEPMEEAKGLELFKRELAKFCTVLSTDYGIAADAGDVERLYQLILRSEPREYSYGELKSRLLMLFHSVWRSISGHEEIKNFVIHTPELPPYQYQPERRIIRGDHLVYEEVTSVKDDTLTMTFEQLHYVQQPLLDCGDYRIERPKGISFADLVGLEHVRDELRETLHYITNEAPDNGLPAPNLNFLLHGPAGTGKTSLALCMAKEADIPVFFATSSIFSDARRLQKMFGKANTYAPCLIIFEEFDSVCCGAYKRDIVNCLLTELDGLSAKNKIMVMASTNRPEILEAPLLRPGRFGRILHIGPPDETARKEYVRRFEAQYKVALSSEVRENFIRDTANCSIAVIRGALETALRRSVRQQQLLNGEHLHIALQQIIRWQPGAGTGTQNIGFKGVTQ